MLNKKLLALTVAGVISTQSIGAESNSIILPERRLSISKEASESIREVQRTGKVADVEVIRGMEIPKTSEEWKSFVSEFNAPGREAGVQLAEKLNVQYEKNTINGVEVYNLTPSTVAPEYKNNLFVHIHGGAWLYGGEESALREAVTIAHNLQIPVTSIIYRKAPDHPAPAAVNDIIAVWADLITERPADSMMTGGTSAGGNLTTASAMRMRDLGMPLPAALFIGTPAATILNTTDSRFIMEGVDQNLGTWDNLIEATAAQYYGDLDPKDPYISPLYGTFEDLPPAFLISGTRDMMLSDTVLLHRAIRGAGGAADLHIYEGHSHGSYGIPGDDHDDFIKELNMFAEENLKSYRRIPKRHLSPPMDLGSLMILEN